MSKETGNKGNGNKKKIIIGVVILAVLAVVFSVLYFGLRDRGSVGDKEISVTVVHRDASQKEFTIETEAAYLGEALLAEGVIAGEEGEYGLYVTEADGETADETNQEWWCVTKGGEAVMTGVDLTPIEDGDQFEITLTVGW